MKKFSLIITAGGTSSRYGNTNKLLEKINDKTVIEETVSKFVDFDEIDEIIISANNSIIEILEELLINPKIKIIEGGNTRQKSVYNALQVAKNEYVLIHDGARAFITPELIEFCIEQVKKDKSCVMGMPVKDTIKIVDEDRYAVSTPPRSTMWQIQTPQCFVTAEIREAYQEMMEAGDDSVTDDGMVMETYGIRGVRMIKGSYENMKITTPEDMLLGEAILKGRSTER